MILGKSDNTAVNLANINSNNGGFVIVGENNNDFSGISEGFIIGDVDSSVAYMTNLGYGSTSTAGFNIRFCKDIP